MLREASGLNRSGLVRRYAWSIPSPWDMAWMHQELVRNNMPGVVEIGAGTGYWADQMRQWGIDVVAYDLRRPGPSNTYVSGGPYFPVLRGGVPRCAWHQDRALFLCWPPRKSTFASRALEAYKGQMLFHAGEGLGGITGDAKFFEVLFEKWEKVGEAEGHFSFWGIDCELTSWRRRCAPNA